MNEKLVEILGTTSEGLAEVLQKAPDVYQALVSEYVMYRALEPILSGLGFASFMMALATLVVTAIHMFEDLEKKYVKYAWIALAVTVIGCVIVNTLLAFTAPNILFIKELLS